MVLVGNSALIALIISSLLVLTLLIVNIKVKKKKQVNWCIIGFISCLLICCSGQILSILLPDSIRNRADLYGLHCIYRDLFFASIFLTF